MSEHFQTHVLAETLQAQLKALTQTQTTSTSVKRQPQRARFKCNGLAFGYRCKAVLCKSMANDAKPSTSAIPKHKNKHSTSHTHQPFMRMSTGLSA